MLQTLLIYPCKQYSITCSFKKCLRTYVLSVICGLKITSLALLFSPNVTSAEVFWVSLGYFGTYIYVYMDKLGESTAYQGQQLDFQHIQEIYWIQFETQVTCYFEKFDFLQNVTHLVFIIYPCKHKYRVKSYIHSSENFPAVVNLG